LAIGITRKILLSINRGKGDLYVAMKLTPKVMFKQPELELKSSGSGIFSFHPRSNADARMSLLMLIILGTPPVVAIVTLLAIWSWR
jgi:hypothetical protein